MSKNKEEHINQVFKKSSDDVVMIEGMVMGFIARYKGHYCVVSINQKMLLIKNENNEVVASRNAGEEYFDVLAFYRLIPDIVINYIDDNLEELNKIKEEKNKEKNDEK